MGWGFGMGIEEGRHVVEENLSSLLNQDKETPDVKDEDKFYSPSILDGLEHIQNR